MSEGWKKMRFSDFVNINPGVKLKVGEKYSFIEMKDLDAGKRNVRPSANRELTGGARFMEGDTLFARITPCLENGKIGVAKNLNNSVGFGSTEFLVFRAKEDISDANFIYYLSCSEEVRSFAVQNMVGTSGRQRVGKEVFDNLELYLPPLEEQRRIASILTALDDKIELNRRMNTTLEGIAGALWEEWFGKESDKLTTLDSLIEFNPKVSIKANQEVTYVEMKDLQSNSLNVSSFTKRTFTSGSKFELNDTLMARITPCLENGKTAFVNFLAKGEKGFGSTEFIILRARKNTSPFFVYFMARNETFRQYAINSMVGSSGRQRVQSNLLPNYEIAQPDTNLMNDFDRFVAPLFEKILINSRENVSLSSTRDILLYHFFQTKTKNHEIA